MSRGTPRPLTSTELWCPSCFTVKPVTEFWRKRGRWQSWCKGCMRAYRWATRDHERELDNKRQRTRRKAEKLARINAGFTAAT